MGKQEMCSTTHTLQVRGGVYNTHLTGEGWSVQHTPYR